MNINDNYSRDYKIHKSKSSTMTQENANARLKKSSKFTTGLSYCNSSADYYPAENYWSDGKVSPSRRHCLIIDRNSTKTKNWSFPEDYIKDAKRICNNSSKCSGFSDYLNQKPPEICFRSDIINIFHSTTGSNSLCYIKQPETSAQKKQRLYTSLDFTQNSNWINNDTNDLIIQNCKTNKIENKDFYNEGKNLTKQQCSKLTKKNNKRYYAYKSKNGDCFSINTCDGVTNNTWTDYNIYDNSIDKGIDINPFNPNTRYNTRDSRTITNVFKNKILFIDFDFKFKKTTSNDNETYLWIESDNSNALYIYRLTGSNKINIGIKKSNTTPFPYITSDILNENTIYNIQILININNNGEAIKYNMSCINKKNRIVIKKSHELSTTDTHKFKCNNSTNRKINIGGITNINNYLINTGSFIQIKHIRLVKNIYELKNYYGLNINPFNNITFKNDTSITDKEKTIKNVDFRNKVLYIDFNLKFKKMSGNNDKETYLFLQADNGYSGKNQCNGLWIYRLANTNKINIGTQCNNIPVLSDNIVENTLYNIKVFINIDKKGDCYNHKLIITNKTTNNIVKKKHRGYIHKKIKPIFNNPKNEKKFNIDNAYEPRPTDKLNPDTELKINHITLL